MSTDLRCPAAARRHQLLVVSLTFARLGADDKGRFSGRMTCGVVPSAVQGDLR
jgi:hypothetical protein